MLSKNINNRIYKSIILPVVLYGSWSPTLREGVWEEGAQENIRIEEKLSERILEKARQRGAS
jgi:hypothetical protein